MQNRFSRALLITIVVGSSLFARAESSDDLQVDGLGNYADTLKSVKQTSGVQEVRVVQNRLSSRKNRSEFLIGYNNYLSGNPYLLTQALSLGYNFSFNRFFSVGINYFTARNGLTNEGRNLINNDLPERLGTNQRILPTVDSIKGGYEANLLVSPFYGKINLFDFVAHFDVYGFGGVGQMQMSSGNKQSISYGVGTAFWWNNHWNTRVEFKNVQYGTESLAGKSNITSSVAGVSLGYIL